MAKKLKEIFEDGDKEERLALSKTINSNIERLLREREWKQYRLSLEANISQATLSKIRNVKGRVPSIAILDKIAMAFEVPVSEITGEKLLTPVVDEKILQAFCNKWKILDELDSSDQHLILRIAERLNKG